MGKYVYFFGGKKAEGGESLRNLLGGKGAGLAEMVNLGIPVPPGFTITTEVCTLFYDQGMKLPEGLKEEVLENLKHVEESMGMRFGDPKNPLLLSIRSGARASMPGMMDTVLNLGLNAETVKGLAELTGNEWFAWDCYRRFVAMYGDVVLGLKPESKEEEDPFERIIDEKKKARGVKLDTEFTVDDLKELVSAFKALIKEKLNVDFPEDPLRAVVGRHRGGLPVLEQREGRDVQEAEQHTRLLGDGGQRAVHGLRQHRAGLRHGRRLHEKPFHRGKRLLRRISPECPGRGRRGRDKDALAHQQGAEDGPLRAVPGRRDAADIRCSFWRSAPSWSAVSRTCRTSSSRSSAASSGCSRRGRASGPLSRSSRPPSTWSGRG